MNVSPRIGLTVGIASVAIVLLLAHRSSVELHRYRSDDPTVWEAEIQAFERADQQSPPPERAVLFLGSSGIRAWNTIDEDLAPLVTLRRGFGGAKLGDVLHYLDRIAVPYRPRAVVLYVGGNDLFQRAGNRPRTAEETFDDCRAVADALVASLPGTPLYFIEQRPPILDARGRDPFSRLNAMLAEFASSRSEVHFIEANQGMYGKDGRLLPEYMSFDRVHLTREGYRAWARPIRERLLGDLGPT